MKKILPLFVSLTCASLSAQTITKATHDPAVNDIESIVPIDTSGFASGMPLNVTGAGSLWDFSSGAAGTSTLNNTYDAPNTYTHGTLFSGASIVQNLIGTMWNYVNSVSTPTTQGELVGIYTSSLAMTFTNSAIIIQYPASLGFNISDPASGTFTISAINGTFDGTTTTTADGSGTLVLPGGATHNNVLRVKCEQNFTLNAGFISGTLDQIVYNFYDPTEKFPLLNVSYIRLATSMGSPTVIAAAFAGADALVPVGLNENTFAANSIFPNPAAQLVTIHAAAGSQVEIFNLQGQRVFTETTGAAKSTVDVSSFAEGIYTVRIAGEKSVETRKLIIAH